LTVANIDGILKNHIKKLREKDTTIDNGGVLLNGIDIGHYLRTSMKTDYFRILNDNYYVLLTVRLKKIGKHSEGLFNKVCVIFNIVGGKNHLGEMIIACAKCELEEETHISLHTHFYDSAAIDNNVDPTGTYYYIDVSEKML
jgi:hypothetical protein